ncbi:hypothetical protein JB92DRAFT_3135278 [Gautieria morchelliformis]|nr:hypothetical protein JB92DRAFT_3135278 [Gautieria morchelliformis]
MSDVQEPTIEELEKLLEEEEWERDVRLEKLREQWRIAQECKEAAERKRKVEEEQKLVEERRWRAEALQKTEEDEQWGAKKPNIAWEVWNEEQSKKLGMEEDEEVAKGPLATACSGVTGACLGQGRHASLVVNARFGAHFLTGNRNGRSR